MGYVLATINILAGLLFLLWQAGTFAWRAGHRSPLIYSVIRKLRWPSALMVPVMVTTLMLIGTPVLLLAAVGIGLGWAWGTDWDIEHRMPA